MEALAARYGYDRVTLLDRAETAARARLGAFRRRHARPRRRPSRPLPLRARPCPRGRRASAPQSTNARPRVSLGRDGRPRRAHGARRRHAPTTSSWRPTAAPGSFEQITRRRMVGINSFIVVTEPLGADGECDPARRRIGGRQPLRRPLLAQDPDGRLIFGGGESNAGRIPADVSAFVRPHLGEIYPQTRRRRRSRMAGAASSRSPSPRLPYVREIAPAVWAAGGYSGQGVALAPVRRQAAWRRRRSAARSGSTPSRTFPSPLCRSPPGSAAC